MAQLLDLINVGPEEINLTPMDLQQIISWAKGYPGSGGDKTFLNELDDVMFSLDNNGVYATPDDGSTAPAHVMVDTYHGFVGQIIETDVNPATLTSWWHVCDGTGGTPDLRGRFVIGVSGSYAANTTGGNATLNLQHQHDIPHQHPHDHGPGSYQLASHTHGAGSYANGVHQHSAGTLTAAGHQHGGNTLSWPHEHDHDHGMPTHDHKVDLNHDHGTQSTGDRNNTTPGGAFRFDEPNVSSGTEDHHHSVDIDPLGSTLVDSQQGLKISDDGTFTSTSSSSDGVSSTSSWTGLTSSVGASVTGNTGNDTAAFVTGTSGGSGVLSVTGDSETVGTASDTAYSGTTLSATTSILPPYYALYRVKRVA